MALPSGFVTFLFTDVVGSTRLFQQHGDSFVTELQEVQRLIRAGVESVGGVVVGTEGDSTFAAFETAAAGVEGAVSAQTYVLELGGPLGLSIRAGLHSGTALPIQDDYLAVPVHVAARVSSAAGSGQVLASDDTVQAVPAPPPGATDLGPYELKDVLDPVRLWRLLGPPDPPRASPLRRTNVQEAHTSLIGRESDLARLTQLLSEHRLVTVVGAGGMGKTRVVSELATRLAPTTPGGAWLVELAGVDRDDAVPLAVRDVLNVPPDLSDDALASELNRRGKTLLVLDNCEHVLDGAADLVDHLLRVCADATILTTSREVLDLPTERVVRLGPLPVGAAGSSSAEELFRQRSERAGAALLEQDATVVTEICQLLDGLPLAVELAASRAAGMPLPALLQALRAPESDGTLLSRRGEHRQRSLEELVQWSVRMLSEEQRTDLICLAAFAARFSREDAEVLLRAARGERASSLDELVRRSLVDLDGDRYRLLFAVREPMARRLRSQPELATRVDEALVVWANARVHSARQEGWRGALDSLAPERPNLEVALRAALKQRRPAARVLQMLERVWDRDDAPIPLDVRQGIEQWLAEPLPNDVDGLHMRLALLNHVRGIGLSDVQAARLELASQLLDAARALGDVPLLVDALSTAGPVFTSAGQRELAQAGLEEAIGLAGQGGVWHRPARDLVNLAVLHHIGPRPEEALPWYEQAVAVAERTADPDNRGVALANMGDVLLTAGRLQEATAFLRRAVHSMGNMSRSQTAARAILADALLRMGEPNAVEFAREAERDLTELCRTDPSMSDYLERLRGTIAATEADGILGP